MRDQSVDLAPLIVGRAAHGIVRALLAGDRVECAQRIVLDRRRVHTDVIVVRADEHVLAGLRRIGAGQDRDEEGRSNKNELNRRHEEIWLNLQDMLVQK